MSSSHEFRKQDIAALWGCSSSGRRRSGRRRRGSIRSNDRIKDGSRGIRETRSTTHDRPARRRQSWTPSSSALPEDAALRNGLPAAPDGVTSTRFRVGKARRRSVGDPVHFSNFQRQSYGERILDNFIDKEPSFVSSCMSSCPSGIADGGHNGGGILAASAGQRGDRGHKPEAEHIVEDADDHERGRHDGNHSSQEQHSWRRNPAITEATAPTSAAASTPRRNYPDTGTNVANGGGTEGYGLGYQTPKSLGDRESAVRRPVSPRGKRRGIFTLFKEAKAVGSHQGMPPNGKRFTPSGVPSMSAPTPTAVDPQGTRAVSHVSDQAVGPRLPPTAWTPTTKPTKFASFTTSSGACPTRLPDGAHGSQGLRGTPMATGHRRILTDPDGLKAFRSGKTVTDRFASVGNPDPVDRLGAERSNGYTKMVDHGEEARTLGNSRDIASGDNAYSTVIGGGYLTTAAVGGHSRLSPAGDSTRANDRSNSDSSTGHVDGGSMAAVDFSDSKHIPAKVTDKEEESDRTLSLSQASSIPGQQSQQSSFDLPFVTAVASNASEHSAHDGRLTSDFDAASPPASGGDGSDLALPTTPPRLLRLHKDSNGVMIMSDAVPAPVHRRRSRRRGSVGGEGSSGGSEDRTSDFTDAAAGAAAEYYAQTCADGSDADSEDSPGSDGKNACEYRGGLNGGLSSRSRKMFLKAGASGSIGYAGGIYARSRRGSRTDRQNLRENGAKCPASRSATNSVHKSRRRRRRRPSFSFVKRTLLGGFGSGDGPEGGEQPPRDRIARGHRRYRSHDLGNSDGKDDSDELALELAAALLAVERDQETDRGDGSVSRKRSEKRRGIRRGSGQSTGGSATNSRRPSGLLSIVKRSFNTDTKQPSAVDRMSRMELHKASMRAEAYQSPPRAARARASTFCGYDMASEATGQDDVTHHRTIGREEPSVRRGSLDGGWLGAGGDTGGVVKRRFDRDEMVNLQ